MDDQNRYLDAFRLPATFPQPRVVAEIGCNHRGDFDTALEMIVVAKTCGADVAKFQKRNARELLTEEQYNAPYDNENSYGRTYGEHREFLEFDLETHRRLKTFCDERGIVYATSVWDITSAREIASLNPEYVKIPAACNNHHRMLKFLRDEFSGAVHMSVGMTTGDEELAAVDIFKSCPERLVLYSCTSGYPVPFDDVCILEILRLKETYEKPGKVGSVGFSGHHNGYSVDTIAALLGVSMIERHFTLDRTWRGSDHAASLEPGGFRRLTRDIQNIARTWSFKRDEILPIEAVQRNKLKFRER